MLLISRILLTGVALYSLFFIWTNDVDFAKILPKYLKDKFGIKEEKSSSNGGDAKATSGGSAFGGHGGKKGGNGGSAEASGPDSLAVGGNGG